MSFSETLSNTHKQHPSTVIKKKEGRERERERERMHQNLLLLLLLLLLLFLGKKVILLIEKNKKYRAHGSEQRTA